MCISGLRSSDCDLEENTCTGTSRLDLVDLPVKSPLKFPMFLFTAHHAVHSLVLNFHVHVEEMPN